MFYVLKPLYGSWYSTITFQRECTSDIQILFDRYGTDTVLDCVVYVGF
jgi:hypothetical protein